MKKQNYLCVDLTTLMKEEDLKVMESRKGTLCRNEEDKFTFTEKGAKPHEVRKWKHWHLIKRIKNDMMSAQVTANDAHVKLEIYLKHEAYTDGRDLADQLAMHTEELGETLCETDMAKLVESIRALNPQAAC